LVANDFNGVCSETVEGTLSYIRLTQPSLSQGTLYTNYSTSTGTGTVISSSTNYNYTGSTNPISGITFKPNASFTGDTVIINYTGYNNASPVRSFAGQIVITLSGTMTNTIHYTTPKGTAVYLNVDDFTTACTAALGSSASLSDIQFSSPLPTTSSSGELRYNYSSTGAGTAVTTGTQLYRTSSPSINNTAFVPNANYTGTVTISFTGRSAGNTTFSGQVRITVMDPITYATNRNTPVIFALSDFNAACTTAVSGSTLDYVMFTLPASSNGTLRYNYTSVTSTGTPVTSTTRCYRANTTPLISTVAFVPDTSFTGTVTINYLGQTTAGATYRGQIRITVGDAANITYSTNRTTPVTFNVNDFTAVCTSAVSGTLDYVSFTLPAAAQGTLYYNYNASTKTGTPVASSNRCYRAGNTQPLIGNVTFVPNTSFSGAVTIQYTGFNTAGASYTGQVVITVSASSRYFKDVTSTSYSWAVDAVDYLFEKGVVNGTSPNVFSPANNIKRGDFMLMLVRAYDLKAGNANTNFSDVRPGTYYYDAIAVAKALGIAQGTTSGRFNPDASITREDAMVLMARTLDAVNISIPAGSAADLAGFSDAASVSGYARDAVATLVKAGVIQGSNNRLNPKNTMSRAEMAVALHRLLTR